MAESHSVSREQARQIAQEVIDRDAKALMERYAALEAASRQLLAALEGPLVGSRPRIFGVAAAAAHLHEVLDG